MNQHTLPKAIWKTIVAVFLLMPLVVTVVYAFSARWVHILPEGFTLHYSAATLTNQKFLLGIGRGLLISFVPVVITIAVVAAAVWLLLGYPVDFALSIGIAVLVISCPCALGLATQIGRAHV